MNIFENKDCMEGMREYPDKFFDLAIVDPPYGIGEDGASNHSRSRLANAKVYSPKGWDRETPPEEYFKELFRVSKNQIIWGGNYFLDKIKVPTPCMIVWDKENGDNDFADCELAWSSFQSAVRKFRYRWAGMLQGNMKEKEVRIHPTQKPAALYKWLLQNYAKKGDKILDTHVGSASSLIACIDLGFDYVGFEIDKEYYDNACKRIENFKSQLKLF
jgi:site-specific DNA-methyltransferase (adenine-specific)